MMHAYDRIDTGFISSELASVVHVQNKMKINEISDFRLITTKLKLQVVVQCCPS